MPPAESVRISTESGRAYLGQHPIGDRDVVGGGVGAGVAWANIIATGSPVPSGP